MPENQWTPERMMVLKELRRRALSKPLDSTKKLALDELSRRAGLPAERSVDEIFAGTPPVQATVPRVEATARPDLSQFKPSVTVEPPPVTRTEAARKDLGQDPTGITDVAAQTLYGGINTRLFGAPGAVIELAGLGHEIEPKTPAQRYGRAIGDVAGFIGGPIQLGRKLAEEAGKSPLVQKTAGVALRKAADLAANVIGKTTGRVIGEKGRQGIVKEAATMAMASLVSGNEQIGALIRTPNYENAVNLIATKALSTVLGAQMGAQFGITKEVFNRFATRALANVLTTRMVHAGLSGVGLGEETTRREDLIVQTILDVWGSIGGPSTPQQTKLARKYAQQVLPKVEQALKVTRLTPEELSRLLPPEERERQFESIFPEERTIGSGEPTAGKEQTFESIFPEEAGGVESRIGARTQQLVEQGATPKEIRADAELNRLGAFEKQVEPETPIGKVTELTPEQFKAEVDKGTYSKKPASKPAETPKGDISLEDPTSEQAMFAEAYPSKVRNLDKIEKRRMAFLEQDTGTVGVSTADLAYDPDNPFFAYDEALMLASDRSPSLRTWATKYFNVAIRELNKLGLTGDAQKVEAVKARFEKVKTNLQIKNRKDSLRVLRELTGQALSADPNISNIPKFNSDNLMVGDRVTVPELGEFVITRLGKKGVKGKRKGGRTEVSIGYDKIVDRAPRPGEAPRAPVLKQAATSAEAAPKPEAPKPTEQTPPEALVSKQAYESAKLALEETLKGLKAIVSAPGDPSNPFTGLGYSEKAYEAARPHFDRAWGLYKKAGRSIQDFLTDFANHPDYESNVRPYFQQWMNDRVIKGNSERRFSAENRTYPTPDGDVPIPDELRTAIQFVKNRYPRLAALISDIQVNTTNKKPQQLGRYFTNSGVVEINQLTRQSESGSLEPRSVYGFIDTIVHEIFHGHQKSRGRTKELIDEYIQPETDFWAYFNQPVEKEARRAGSIATWAHQTKSKEWMLRQAQGNIVSAIKESLQGLGQIVKGAMEPDPTNPFSGPGYSEKAYEVARPHFNRAYHLYKKAGKTLKEFAEAMANNPEFENSIRPYLDRWLSERTEGLERKSRAEGYRTRRELSRNLINEDTGQPANPEIVNAVQFMEARYPRFAKLVPQIRIQAYSKDGVPAAGAINSRTGDVIIFERYLPTKKEVSPEVLTRVEKYLSERGLKTFRDIRDAEQVIGLENFPKVDPKEFLRTVAHESTHGLQKLTPSKYDKYLKNYITPQEDFEGYYNQLAEVNARKAENTAEFAYESRPSQRVLDTAATVASHKAKRFISQEKYESAKAEIDRLTRETLSAPSSVVGSVMNAPQIVKNLAVVGAYHFENGVNRIGDWSELLIKEFGEKIKPHLETVWQAVQDIYAGNIDVRKFPQDVQQGLRDAIAEIGFEQYQKQRRGKISDKRMAALAQLQAKFLARIAEKGVKPGTPLREELQVALRSEIARRLRLPDFEKLYETDANFKREMDNLMLADIGDAAATGRKLRWRGLNVDPKLAPYYQALARLTGDKTIRDAINKALQIRAKKGQNRPVDLLDYILDFSRNAMLSTISPALKSVLGNAQLLFLEYPKELLSAAYNKPLAKLFGVQRDRFSLETFANMSEGLLNADSWRRGFKDIVSTMTENEAALEQNEFLQRETGGVKAFPGAWGKLIRSGQNLQGASDAFFTNLLLPGKINALVTRKALQEGQSYSPRASSKFAKRAQSLYDQSQALLKARADAKRIARESGYTEGSAEYQQAMMEHLQSEITKLPDYETVLRIVADAKKSTNEALLKGELGPISRAINDTRMKYRVLQIFLPFFPTIVNAFRVSTAYSPFGFVMPSMMKALYRAVHTQGEDPSRLRFLIGQERAQRLKAEPKQVGDLSDQLAKATLGTLIMSAGFEAVFRTLGWELTGDPPEDQKEKKLAEANGVKWNSIRTKDGTYIPYTGLEPVSTWLGLMASWRNAAKEGATYGDRVASATYSLFRNYLQNPFLTSINDMMEAFERPSKASDWIANFVVGRTIPTTLRQSRWILDPNKRETDAEGVLQETGKKILSRVPFASRLLPSELDAFGDEVKDERGLTAITGFPVGRETDDPVWNELIRIGKPINPPTNTYKGRELTEDQHHRVWLLAGDLRKRSLRSLFRLPAYQQADSEQKVRMVDRVLSAADEVMKNRLFEGLEGERATPLPKDFNARELIEQEALP